MPEAETVMFATLEADRQDDAPQYGGESTKILQAIKLAGREKRSPRSTPRRKWLSRACLLVILVMQAILSLRLNNTAFEDEALYLYVGHLEIAHILHGASLQGNYPSYFSGAPVLYPVLAAMADDVGGLAAARALSLVEMLAATAIVFSIARQLFNERVGLCAALAFAAAEPTIFLGHFATYDATSLCLLALASWIVVRTAAFRWPVYLLAAPIATLAVATKYAALLFVPGVIALAGLTAWLTRGRRALIPPAALTITIAGLLFWTVRLAGPDYLQGIDFSTLTRSTGTSTTSSLLWMSVKWIGLPFALAVLGAVCYTITPANEPGERIAPAGSRLRRATLGLALASCALLAPAEQIRIHTYVSLQKHVGFGLFFAAPIAGVGLARLVGDHFRRAQLGILVWCAALVLGFTQAADLFTGWSNTNAFVANLARYLKPGAHYLVEVDEVPIYYLRHDADAQPDQFTSTYNIGYVAANGKYLTGIAGYVAAIKAGYFRVVSYNDQTTPAVDQVIARTLEADPAYRLVAAIPNSTGTITQYVWVHT